jgi:hypothetical protein
MSARCYRTPQIRVSERILALILPMTEVFLPRSGGPDSSCRAFCLLSPDMYCRFDQASSDHNRSAATLKNEGFYNLEYLKQSLTIFPTRRLEDQTRGPLHQQHLFLKHVLRFEWLRISSIPKQWIYL